MSQRRSQITIQGMSCANCSQSITDAVESVDGVSDANINFGFTGSSDQVLRTDFSVGSSPGFRFTIGRSTR